MSEDRAPTIYDVAEAAGVSASTVSRTFSRPGRVSSRTARQVWAAAEALGYRSDHIFRPQTPTHSTTIGLAIADITNPVFFPVIRGAEQEAAESGYQLVLADAQESGDVERRLFTHTLDNIAGIVCVAPRLSDTDLRSLAKHTRVVVLTRHVAGLPSIVPDYASGIEAAVEHLAGLGHRRICYIAGPETSWADGTRWRAVRETGDRMGLTTCRVGPFTPTVEGGRGAAAVVHKRHESALVVYNDVMAMGLLRGLPELGLRVPDEVSLVSFDNIFAADLVSPPLTTIAAPLMSLGASGVRYVVANAGRDVAAPERPMVLPVRLIVRESTATAR